MSLSRLPRLLVYLLASACAFVAVADAQRSDARSDLKLLNLEKKDLAIEGYDPVAYFPEGGGKPREGKKNLTAAHRGVTYRFANEANRAAFLATPDRFEPAYGGWCAYAMADDDRVEVDPETFLIQDGELLLFYNGFWGNTRKKWNKEGPEKLRVKADGNWNKYHPGAERDLSGWALDGGVALGGHDPVQLVGGKAAKGKAGVTWTYKSVTYRFADEASRKRFRAAPHKYEPAFGGHDAVALGEGKREAGVAAHAAVHEGRLFVFSSAERLAAFQKEPAAAIKKAGVGRG